MPTMNKNTLLSSAVFVCAFVSSAWAVSGDTSAYQGAVFNAESPKAYEALYNGSPRFLSIGGYYEQEKRGIDINGGMQDWEVQQSVGYVGVDLTRWLTVRGGGGQNTLRVDKASGDSDLEWIAGGTLRLLDYFILDPVIGEESYWLGVNLDGQYTGARSHAPSGDLTWNEVSVALLFNLTAHTERWGFVDRVSLYAGPAYSGIAGNNDGGFGANIREDKSVGLIAGLAFGLSDNVTIKTELQDFGDTSFSLGASFHF